MRTPHSTFHIPKIQIHVIKHHNYLGKPPSTNQPTMSSSDAQQIEELKNEMRELKAKNTKLEKEMQQVKDEMNAKNKNLEKELEKVKEKNEKLEKELRELKKDHHQQIDQIANDYARTLPAPDSNGRILLKNGNKYTPEIDIFLRYGAANCNHLSIRRGTSVGFVGYPANFFEDLIKHYYETKVPTKAVHHVVITLSLTNPAPWPTALVQPRAGEMKVEKFEIDNDAKLVHYILPNKHNSDFTFWLLIYFEGEAKCYQQMTSFAMQMVDVQSGEV